MSKGHKEAAARSFEDEEAPADVGSVPETGTQESLLAGVVDLLDQVAAAEAADPRTKLAFVQFKVPARLQGRSAVVPVIARTKGTRIFIETVAGVICVVVEGPAFPKRAYVPWDNVAAFGLLT